MLKTIMLCRFELRKQILDPQRKKDPLRRAAEIILLIGDKPIILTADQALDEAEENMLRKLAELANRQRFDLDSFGSLGKIERDVVSALINMQVDPTPAENAVKEAIKKCGPMKEFESGFRAALAAVA